MTGAVGAVWVAGAACITTSESPDVFSLVFASYLAVAFVSASGVFSYLGFFFGHARLAINITTTSESNTFFKPFIIFPFVESFFIVYASEQVYLPARKLKDKYGY